MNKILTWMKNIGLLIKSFIIKNWWICLLLLIMTVLILITPKQVSLLVTICFCICGYFLGRSIK